VSAPSASDVESRVAIWGPGARDSQLMREVLQGAGVATALCADANDLRRTLDEGAAAVIVSEEAILVGSGPLEDFLRTQPAWSDLPILLLTTQGADSPTVMRAIETLGNVTILERPARVTALITGALAAIRSRRRQYQTRAHLVERAWTEQLRATELAVARLLSRWSAQEPILEILRAVVDGIGWSAGAVWLVSEKGLRNSAFWASSELRVPRLEAATRSLRSADAGLSGRVLATGVPVWIPDVTKDVHDARVEEAVADGLRGALAFPIRRNTEIVAVVELFSRTSEPPDDQLLATLSTIGSHLGQSLERRRVENALHEADRRKDEFLATLAHELRNPLAPIRLAAQVLRTPGTTPPDLEWASDVIERHVGHLGRLVEDLMDVSRVARGKIALRRTRTDLASVVQAAVETSSPLMNAAGHRLELSLPEERFEINADPLRLSQVLSNLLNNAAKFTPPGGIVRLEAEREGGDLVVRVTDTGAGIPQDMLDRIFELFMQVEPSGDRPRSGLGIGLTIVRSFVHLHGGTVVARSEGPGQGSEFVVRLPVALEEAAAAPFVEALPRPGACRVLVVDDNVDSADGLAMILRLEGHEVRTANDGLSAVAAAEEFEPQLILLDIGLPGVDGYEAARRIRLLPKGQGVRLVALTGWGQREDRRRSREAGFDRHLVKPLEPAQLEKIVSEISMQGAGKAG